jgi:hypothetical protein
LRLDFLRVPPPLCSFSFPFLFGDTDVAFIFSNLGVNGFLPFGDFDDDELGFFAFTAKAPCSCCFLSIFSAFFHFINLEMSMSSGSVGFTLTSSSCTCAGCILSGPLAPGGTTSVSRFGETD